MSNTASDTPLHTPADLADDTAVTGLPKAPGWYTAELPDAWNFLTPSGGVLMTVALRAMQAELGDHGLRPLSATTLFMSPVPHGPMEIRVEVLRRGGAAAQLRAGLSSTSLPGPGLEVSATFARDLEIGPSFTDAVMPDVPPPSSAADLVAGRGDEAPRFMHNFEMVLAEGPAFWEGPDWEAGPARFARWYRYLRPQHLEDGQLDRLALPPVVDNMPPAVFAACGPQARDWHAPSLDLTVHFLEDTDAEWLLLANRSRKARSGHATADVEVWTPDGTLVAYGTQTMIFRRWPGF